MVARKKRTTSSQAEAGPGRVPVRKSTPLGPDTALTLPTAKGRSLELSFWDLWFALVAVKDFGGDLDRLANHLGEKRSFVSFDRRSAERKRNHLRDLKRRLEEISVTPDQIVAAAGDLRRTELRRAVKKVRESCDREQEWSLAMRDTPRKERFEHALRGFWPRFPVSPEPYAEEIGSHFRTKSLGPERASFGLSRTLDCYVERAETLVKSGKYAEAQSVLRACMTAVIDLMEHADGRRPSPC